MKTTLIYLLISLVLLFANVVASLDDIIDNIILPYERFQFDLERFIPVMNQEVEFAELRGITDDQAYEQIRTFFPILQLRIQQLRNVGIIADENRIKKKEAADQMCGQGHSFGYLLLNRKLRNLNEVLNLKKITAKNSLQMLTDIRNLLKKWADVSKFPCRRLTTARNH